MKRALRSAARRRAAEAGPTRTSEQEWAARRLRIRTRKQVTDLFAGHYVSAFRGEGLEYAESRLYVPGDDVRSLDWNATARSGVPHVKQYRPERGRSLVAAVDLSPSMQFGTTGRSKAVAAAEAVAILATAALGVGDRFGLILHGPGGLLEIAAARGESQRLRLLDALAARVDGAPPPPDTSRPGHAASLDDLLARRRRQGAAVCEFTDGRGARWNPTAETAGEATARGPGASSGPRRSGDRDGPDPATPHGWRGALRRAAGEHIVVLCSDPSELRWPSGQRVRIRHGASGRPLLFAGDDDGVRARFEAAARARVDRIARAVRASGGDFTHLRCDHDPLRAWLEFFRRRESGWSPRP